MIKATDQKGNYLVLKLTLRKHRLAETSLFLKLNNNIYQLPASPEVTLSSITNQQIFKAAGLELQILEPYRRLRVLYNGLLLNSKGGLEYFRFNFIWTSAGKPLFHPNDTSVDLLADALAREKWRDGNWLQLLYNKIYIKIF